MEADAQVWEFKQAFRGHIERVSQELAPDWLKGLQLNRGVEWKIILYLETEKSILFRKRIFANGLTTEQFANAMAVFYSKESKDFHGDVVPTIKNEALWKKIFELTRLKNANQQKSIRIICDTWEEKDYEEIKKGKYVPTSNYS